jgi:hypothetical protein
MVTDIPFRSQTILRIRPPESSRQGTKNKAIPAPPETASFSVQGNGFLVVREGGLEPPRLPARS